MSVEDVMKVNKMAKEFLDQGICSSRDEAVKKAQETLNKEIAGNDIKVEEAKQSTVVEDDSVEKLKNMLERMKDQTERRFEAYKNALMALEKEIVALKGKITTASLSKPEPSAPEPKIEEGAEPEAKEEKKESHPKRGNYNPDDVAVEKMFYMGNK